LGIAYSGETAGTATTIATGIGCLDVAAIEIEIVI